MIIHSSDPLLDETSKRTSLTEGKCVRVDVRVIELGIGNDKVLPIDYGHSRQNDG